MGVSGQSARNIVIGAGNIFYNGVDLGATDDNNVFRVVTEIYTPELNGIPGFLKGTDYKASEMAELEFTMSELSAEKIPIAVPGAVATAGDATGVAAGGGASTTLAAAVSPGDTNVKLTAVTGITAGDVLQVAGASGKEFRAVTAVGTAGAGGTGVDVAGQFTLAHASGQAVVEVASTTLTADAPAGSTTLSVASATGLTEDDFARFGYATESGVEQEVRQLTNVSGTTLTLSYPAQFSHRAGDLLMKQTDSGLTIVRSTVATARRIPESAYQDAWLVVDGLTGPKTFKVFNAIAVDTFEVEADDKGTMKPRVKLQSRIDGANQSGDAWQIIL